MDMTDEQDADVAMADLATAMATEVIDESIIGAPASSQQQQTQQQQPPTMTTATQPQSQRRPFDELGPPSPPMAFPRPRFERGRRDDVLCYIPSSDKHQVMHNVLFRDYSRECGPDGDNRLRRAYWPIQYKKPIKTIMGHVEICYVLERCGKSNHDSSRGNDDDLDRSSSSSDEEEDDDDVVFQITNKRVAVKVNYQANIERLRSRHAEDPLKEIAAMQLIGDQHPNVLGCIDVLFDDKANLNVVMKYCDHGDMFQLLQETQLQNTEAGLQPGMTEPQARYWFRQLIRGLSHLHHVCGVCHRDLSPENVMIDQDQHCLIIDMGMCLRVPYIDVATRTLTTVEATRHPQQKQQQMSSLLVQPQQPQYTSTGSTTQQYKRCLFLPQGACGKLPYMSPEVYRNRDPFDGCAADIFTCGTILFCMLTGNRSYQRPHASDAQFYWMTHGLNQLLADWDVTLSKEGLHLLTNMLHISPRQRITLDEILNHPWFQYPDEAPLPPPPAHNSSIQAQPQHRSMPAPQQGIVQQEQQKMRNQQQAQNGWNSC